MANEIVVGGVTYRPITQELYAEILEAQRKNRGARYLGVEEFRLWCQANKGTETVAEGLAACTPEELYNRASTISNQVGIGWTDMLNLLYPLVRRLNARAERATLERASVAVTHVLPEEVMGHGT